MLDLRGVYERISPPVHLRYSWHWETEPNIESLVSTDFLDQDGRTEVRLAHDGFQSEAERDNHVLGWNDCLDRLAELAGSG